MVNKVTEIKCEWCGQTYPWEAKERYYQIMVFDTVHLICGDCYDHLKEVE